MSFIYVCLNMIAITRIKVNRHLESCENAGNRFSCVDFREFWAQK